MDINKWKAQMKLHHLLEKEIRIREAPAEVQGQLRTILFSKDRVEVLQATIELHKNAIESVEKLMTTMEMYPDVLDDISMTEHSNHYMEHAKNTLAQYQNELATLMCHEQKDTLTP